MLKNISVLLLVMRLYVRCEKSLPQSPCPSTFQYEYYGSNNEPCGVMRFRNDLSGHYKVEVNVSVAALTNKNIQIKRMTSSQEVQNGDNVVYRILFPPIEAIPTITSIIFNDNRYCSSTSDMEPGSNGMTNLYAYDFFSTPTRVTAQPKPVSPLFPSTLFQSTQQTQQQTTVSLPPSFPSSPSSVSTFPTLKPTTLESQLSTLTQLWTAFMMAQSMITTQRPGTTQPISSSSSGSSSPITTTTKGQESSTIRFTTIIHNRNFETDECGVGEDTQPLVVHGKPTSEGQFPWLTAMFHVQDDEYKFKCAANLVSKKHVITAAHCVRFDKIVISKENVILVLGKHNIRQWAIRSEIRDIKKIYVHPDYNQPSDADIAILTMKTPVEYSSNIKPVCLWIEDTKVDTIVGNEGTVVGWGKDESDEAYVPEPKQLSMPVISQEDCLRSDARFIKLTSRRTFCAGTKKGEGACTGDSGGGFLMLRNGKWMLRGIVSSALTDPNTRSCDVNNYMVFADVSKYMPWIENIMSK